MNKKQAVPSKTPRRKLGEQQCAVRTVRIQNKLGLHARAAASFVKIAFKYQSEIALIKDKQRANAKSIMGLLTLAASKGTKVTIEAVGFDAEEAVDALADLVNNKFGEQ
jgi:phosphocarrier protein